MKYIYMTEFIGNKIRKDIPRCDDLILAGHDRDIKDATGKYIYFGAESIYNDKNYVCRTLVENFEGKDFEDKLQKYKDAINAKLTTYSEETDGKVPEKLQTILKYEIKTEKQKKEEEEKEKKRKKEEEKEKLKGLEKELYELINKNEGIVNERKKIVNGTYFFSGKQQALSEFDTANKQIFNANSDKIKKLNNDVERQRKIATGSRLVGFFSMQEYDGHNETIEYDPLDPNPNHGGKKYKKTRRPRKRSRKSAKKR